MKKIFALLLITNFFISFAQELIVEEKFEKNNIPLNYEFIENTNSIIIQKGKFVGMSKNKQVNQLVSYDSKGNKKVLLENGEYMFPNFSYDGKTICLSDYNALSWKGKKYQILYNGHLSKVIEMDDFYVSKSNDTHQYYFRFGNFKKDDLFMWKRDMNDLKLNKVIVEKPIIDRLFCDNCVKFDDNKVPFSTLQTEEGFEINTLSVHDECKSLIYYRTFYDNNGIKNNEYSYEIKLNENYLTVSSAFDTEYSSSSVRRQELGFVGFLEDKTTKEVYLYGLIGENGHKSSNAFNTPLGYYIFKFNQDGAKIWESINYIDDDKHFSRKWNGFYLIKNLIIQNSKLMFFTGSRLSNSAHFFHLAELNKEDGKIISTDKYEYDIKNINIVMNVDPRDRMFIASYLTDKKLLKNKVLDFMGYIFYLKNQNFKNYIDNITTKDKIMFQSPVANGEDGFWLVETDNETYYKILYFKHE